MKTYKCAYPYCKNDGVTTKENSVKVGARYWCKSCFEENELKAKIRDKFISEIDKVANIKQLNMAIKKLVNDDGNDPRLVLYMIGYIKENNIKIKNPFGLTWVIKDDKMLREYNKKIVTKIANDIRKNIDTNIKTEQNSFNRKPSKPKWLGEL